MNRAGNSGMTKLIKETTALARGVLRVNPVTSFTPGSHAIVIISVIGKARDRVHGCPQHILIRRAMGFMAVEAGKDVVRVRPWRIEIPQAWRKVVCKLAMYWSPSTSRTFHLSIILPIDAVAHPHLYLDVAIQTKCGVIRVGTSVYGSCSTGLVVTAQVIRCLVGTPVGVDPLIRTISPGVPWIGVMLTR